MSRLKIQLIQKKSIVQVINMEKFLERSGLEINLKKDCQIFRVVTLLEQILWLMLILLSSIFFEEFFSHLTSREFFKFRLPKLTFGFLDK